MKRARHPPISDESDANAKKESFTAENLEKRWRGWMTTIGACWIARRKCSRLDQFKQYQSFQEQQAEAEARLQCETDVRRR